eukprot:CAMPEP_0119486462 /NCGR_PEP_ID=MMETSP1344-20130328/12856_1 /TAXON_ID=236787 /ORGANISM="Florenciella parvula, Strain CCMP2471" /LENGTH=119 /DNA_ID=CAMNT_0007521221 /DNA_START=117 /DNA_END=473 /DNA_ORIENTATION=-
MTSIARFSSTFCPTLFFVQAIRRASSALSIACSLSALRTISGGAVYGGGIFRSLLPSRPSPSPPSGLSSSAPLLFHSAVALFMCACIDSLPSFQWCLPMSVTTVRIQSSVIFNGMGLTN